MAVRFRNEHTSWAVDSPITWKIEIFDSTFEDEVTDFEVENGAELNYRGNGDDVNEPILASSLRFSMVVQNETHEDLITDLAGAKEGRFTVVLHKDDVFHWAGVINSPEISFEDTDFPYGFEITAVDGLALLKNYEYKQNITSSSKWTEKYEGQSTLVGIIAQCLQKLPHIVTHFDGSSKFLVTAINWYHDTFADPVTDVTDPFWLTYLDNRGFAKGQGTGAAKFNTCYEVLSYIIGLFNARISLVDGYFLIEQIEHRAATIGANGNYSRYYDYDLTEPLANTLDDAQDISNTDYVKKLRGGTYSFTPALRSARVKQQIDGLQNLIQGFQVSSELPSTGYAVGTVFGDGFNTYVRLTGTVECQLENISMIEGTPQLGVFTIRIELGGDTPEREVTLFAETWTYDPLAWSGGTSGLIDFVVKFNAPAVGETTTVSADINLLFPAHFFFTQGDLVFDFDFEALYFTGVAVDGADYTLSWVLKNHYLDIISALTTPAKTVTYEVVGDDENTEVLEYNTILGDKDSDIVNQWKALLWFDDPDYFYTEPFWGNRNGTRDRPIVQLLAQRLLAARYFPRKVLRGTAVGSAFVIQTPIEERGETYILKGGTYSTVRDEMTGEWVKLAFTSAEFEYLDALYDTGEYEATTPSGGTGGGNTPIDTGGGGSGSSGGDGNGIYSGNGTTSATVTVDGVFTIQDSGADDAFSVDMSGGGVYADSTTAQIIFDDGGNSHIVSVSASGVLINAPSATADNVFVRAAGALVKLQDTGGNVQVGGGATESEARFMEASGNGTNYAAVKSPSSLSANVSFVLPPTSGTANQLLGQNSGATGTEYKTVNGTTNQVTVTHGANSITLATPQDIHTGASPTFSDLTLSDDLLLDGTDNVITMNGSSSNKIDMNGYAILDMGDGSAEGYIRNTGSSGKFLHQGPAVTLTKTSNSGTSEVSGALWSLATDDGAALNNGHVLGNIRYRSRGTSSTAITGASIMALADGSDWTDTSAPTKLVFQTVPNGSAVLAVAQTIRQTGQIEFNNYGGGTFTGTPAYALQVTASGQVIEGAVGGSGDILNGGNTTGATVVIGTNDANALSLETNNVVRATITGGASTGGAWTLTDVTANTNVATENIVTYVANSSGTPSAGFGMRHLFQLESSTTDAQDAASIAVKWLTATHASRTSALTFSGVYNAGSLDEMIQMSHTTATQANVNLTVTNSGSNVYLVLSPKGTGGLLADVPDGTSAGGNARGAYAIDWQIERSANTQVASGANAVIGGGKNNVASAIESAVLSGSGNNATNNRATVVGGTANTASGQYSLVGGAENTASANGTFAFGNRALADHVGQISHAYGRFAANGDAQHFDVVMRRSITGTSETELFLDGSSTRLTISSSRVWTGVAKCTGVVNTVGNGTTIVAGDTYAIWQPFTIKRVGSTTTLLTPVLGTTVEAWADTNMGGAAFTISADDTNDALKVTFTPPTLAGSTTVCRATCSIEVNEIGF